MSTPALVVGRRFVAAMMERRQLTQEQRKVLREATVGKREDPASLVMLDTPEVREALGIDFGKDREI